MIGGMIGTAEEIIHWLFSQPQDGKNRHGHQTRYARYSFGKD
jgi:hypothetical protein